MHSNNFSNFGFLEACQGRGHADPCVSEVDPHEFGIDLLSPIQDLVRCLTNVACSILAGGSSKGPVGQNGTVWTCIGKTCCHLGTLVVP